MMIDIAEIDILFWNRKRHWRHQLIKKNMTRNLAIFVGVLALSLYNREHLPLALTICGYGSAVVLGLLFGAGICLFTGKKYTTDFKEDSNTGKVLKTLLNLKCSRKEEQQLTIPNSKLQQATFSRNVDAVIDDFINLLMRDFVLFWLKPLILDANSIADDLKNDIWTTLTNLKDRLVTIDELKLLTHDFPEYLCQHYQRIRQASNSLNSKERKPVILLRSYLSSKEKELDFLRKVSELIIVQLSPKSYSQSPPIKHLIREILSVSVLYPAINQLCDPDFINLKLLDYLQRHQEELEKHKQTYAYAASYEDFIKLIQKCENTEQLKHVLNNIMIEISDATAINTLKKSKGIDVEKEFISSRNTKGDLLQARNLKRHLNQLNFAKSTCEKRIELLSKSSELSPKASLQDVSLTDSQYYSQENILPFQKLVDCDFARCFFLKFLLKEDSRFLLEFYVAVEELKSCIKEKQHELGSEIYQTHIPRINNVIKLDRNILKGMEAFLMGNKGPEAFGQAQEVVCKYVEERFYPNFIVSDIYRQMLTDAKRIGVDFEINYPTEECIENIEETLAVRNTSPSSIQLSDQTSFAKTRLEQLSEKLSNKMHALKAVQNLPMGESKLQGTHILEKEIEEMKAEKEILISHIENTDLWIENLGNWAVDVHSVELVKEKDKEIPYFLLVVRLDDSEGSIENEDENEPLEEEDDDEIGKTKSWLVKRKLSDFVVLSHKLAQIVPSVKSIDLPKESKLKSKGSDITNFDIPICILNDFMFTILQDDKLNRSELLYAFLSPSPDYLKQTVQCQKKSKFFFSNLFKSKNNSQEEESDDDELIFFDETDSSLKDDRIAEPLYSLIEEIFDMRGVSNLLRRTLITFVQITFGQTINRQIRETTSWMVSESMIVYYINLLKDSIWPEGQLSLLNEPRSDEQKLETRNQTHQQLLISIPDMFSNIFGKEGTRKGVKKVFESLQDLRLNKQLFYELFELLLIELFPELKTERLF